MKNVLSYICMCGVRILSCYFSLHLSLSVSPFWFICFIHSGEVKVIASLSHIYACIDMKFGFTGNSTPLHLLLARSISFAHFICSRILLLYFLRIVFILTRFKGEHFTANTMNSNNYMVKYF